MKIQDIIKYKVGTPVFLDYKGINTLYSHIITNYPIENIAKSYKITFDNNFYFIRDKEITYILHIENIDQKWDVKNFIKELLFQYRRTCNRIKKHFFWSIRLLLHIERNTINKKICRYKLITRNNSFKNIDRNTNKK